MNFLLDHDVPEAIARVATQAGHGVTRLRDVLPVDVADAEVLAFAHSQQMVLATCNRDHFLALAGANPHSGLVVLVRRGSRVAECSHFLKRLREAGEGGLRGNINFA